MFKYGIVILNYNSHSDTIDLTNNLLSFNITSLKIVIVDNCSSREGFDEVIAKFLTLPNVHVIENKENRGYGYGNNIGIKYLLDSGVRYILISNPDIEINSPYVLHEMFRIIKENKYPVIAPQVLNVQSQIINPSNRKRPSNEEIEKIRLRHSTVFRYIYYFILCIIYLLSFNKWNRKRKNFDHNPSIKTTEVYRVHGSFFMIDLKFFITNNIFPVFDENVFLFFEEYIIAEKVKSNEGKILLLNYVNVLHKEDASQKKDILNRIKYEIMASRALGYVYNNYFKVCK
ncbi:MAG: glycosyltransferase family 2 protein [Bacteroidales bacterium]|nr:glycosyltransferase family 2 protein [Bacteroidales bacterium]